MQEYRDFEHIIVDGASSDNTLEVARKNATPNLRILSERDRGLYDAMNKGLRLARGQYVIFLNAGDAFHNRYTLSLYAAAISRDMDIIYGETEIVDAQRNILGPRHKRIPDVLTPESWLDGMLICHQAFMVRRSIAPEYDLKWKYSADYEWTLKCIRATTPGKCENLNAITIDYLNEGETTRNHTASLIERFRIMKNEFGILPTIKSHISFLHK